MQGDCIVVLTKPHRNQIFVWDIKKINNNIKKKDLKKWVDSLVLHYRNKPYLRSIEKWPDLTFVHHARRHYLGFALIRCFSY